MKTFTLHPEDQPPLTMVGCGILRNEVDFLIEKNGWNVHTHFLDSALHNYLNKLSIELNKALEEHEKLGEKNRGALRRLPSADGKLFGKTQYLPHPRPELHRYAGRL